MKIGIACYPTYGGSGVVASELGKALAERGHKVHFISYAMPIRLSGYLENIFYHEVEISNSLHNCSQYDRSGPSPTNRSFAGIFC